jgi:hypothetical protein
MPERPKKTWIVAVIAIAAIAIAAGVESPTLAQSRSRERQGGEVALEKSIHASVDRVVERLRSDGDFLAANRRMNDILEQVIAYAPSDAKTLFRDVAYIRRLIRVVEASDDPGRLGRFEYLLAHEPLGEAMAFLIKPDYDDPAEVFAVFDRLYAARRSKVADYPELTAAICVVHDKPMTRQINENSVASIDPVLIFDYFSRNEGKMLFGMRGVPAELLVFVVDTTANLDEMAWALERYAGDQMVGRRFFDISYDYDHFRKGDPKKVTEMGFNLPNIKQYGGVCADQAYFAMTVGKSIGVPTTYNRGWGSTTGHAWVGFLQASRKGGAWWNFDVGRYREYQGVRGWVLDPQTREQIPDSYVSVLADFVQAKKLDRQFAAAATDAARRLSLVELSKRELRPPSPTGEALEPIRRAVVADELALLEAGLRACPGYADAWFTVRWLAEIDQLSDSDKMRWAAALDRLCGDAYPDFLFTLLDSMIETVDDVESQNRLWEMAFQRFRKRHDLAAEVRMRQAAMWLEHGEPMRAGKCYEDVIMRYADAGPFVIKALLGAEKILRDARNGRAILRMYDNAWSRIKQPDDISGPFARQSNWYRIGSLLADRLDEAGNRVEAQRIRTTLKKAVRERPARR